MDFIFHTQEQDFHNKINYLLDEIDDYYVTSPPAKADDEQPGLPWARHASLVEAGGRRC